VHRHDPEGLDTYEGQRRVAPWLSVSGRPGRFVSFYGGYVIRTEKLDCRLGGTKHTGAAAGCANCSPATQAT
jgi:hypothetical protein